MIAIYHILGVILWLIIGYRSRRFQLKHFGNYIDFNNQVKVFNNFLFPLSGIILFLFNIPVSIIIYYHGDFCFIPSKDYVQWVEINKQEQRQEQRENKLKRQQKLKELEEIRNKKFKFLYKWLN